MRTLDDELRRAMVPSVDGVRVTLDPAFQGLPDMAHGGTVLAVVDAAAAREGARRVRGHYHRRVPVGEPLTLVLSPEDDRVRASLTDGAGAVLLDGGVESTGLGMAGARVRESPRGANVALPVSRTCFACGVDNPLGLRARLWADDANVGTTWEPLDRFRATDGCLSVVALTTLLDETAFWLGALATGEAGMTTVLDITLTRTVKFGVSIVLSGRRADVKPTADPRYHLTRVVARQDGRTVAFADITFVAVRGAARKLAAGLLALNPPEVLRRVFPAYVR